MQSALPGGNFLPGSDSNAGPQKKPASARPVNMDGRMSPHAVQLRTISDPLVHLRSRLPRPFFALILAAVFLVGACSHHETEPPRAVVTPLLKPPLTPLFDDLERRTFNYFWETADPDTGLIPDRYPYTEPFS